MKRHIYAGEDAVQSGKYTVEFSAWGACPIKVEADSVEDAVRKAKKMTGSVKREDYEPESFDPFIVITPEGHAEYLDY